MKENQLTVDDKFQIFEQLQLHQYYIDNDASRESAITYTSLYWPDAKFTANDLRHVTFDGPEGMKQLYDYAHSVFPIHLMRHSMGTFRIDGAGSDAFVQWYWVVSWREGNSGVLSTGIYNDKFQKRDGVWKCLERISNIDPNWPAAIFQPWIDKEKETFKAS